jgi:glycosyltransferase involved in cell wall biosynthesis
LNIYFGIPSGNQINLEEKTIAERLISTLGNLACHARDFTPDDPYPFEAISGTPSLIHAFHMSKSGLPCLSLAEKHRLPLIVSCTGMDTYIDLFNPGLRNQLQALLERADKIIVPYPQMAKFIQARVQTNPSFEIITPGVSPINEDLTLPLETFGLNSEERVIILEGGILPVKNILFGVHSIEKIISDYPDLRLVILDSPTNSAHKSQIETEISNKSWVSILERPEMEMLPYLYKASEVFLLLSHVEGYNPFLLNAMQSGTPILASDIPANHAFIRNEALFPETGNGLLYFTSPGPSGYKRIHDTDDFISKLKFILDEKDKAKEIAQRAKQTVKTSHSIQKEIYLHLQLYKKILRNL